MKSLEEFFEGLLLFAIVMLPGPALMIGPSLGTLLGTWTFPDDSILKLFFIGMGTFAFFVIMILVNFWTRADAIQLLLEELGRPR